MKFDLKQEVTVISGVWAGYTGKIMGYKGGKYQVHFAGGAMAAVTVNFRTGRLKAAGRNNGPQ